MQGKRQIMIKFFDNYPVSLSMPAHPRGYKYSHKNLNISVSHVSQQKNHYRLKAHSGFFKG